MHIREFLPIDAGTEYIGYDWLYVFVKLSSETEVVKQLANETFCYMAQLTLEVHEKLTVLGYDVESLGNEIIFTLVSAVEMPLHTECVDLDGAKLYKADTGDFVVMPLDGCFVVGKLQNKS